MTATPASAATVSVISVLYICVHKYIFFLLLCKILVNSFSLRVNQLLMPSISLKRLSRPFQSALHPNGPSTDAVSYKLLSATAFPLIDRSFITVSNYFSKTTINVAPRHNLQTSSQFCTRFAVYFKVQSQLFALAFFTFSTLSTLSTFFTFYTLYTFYTLQNGQS